MLRGTLAPQPTLLKGVRVLGTPTLLNVIHSRGALVLKLAIAEIFEGAAI